MSFLKRLFGLGSAGDAAPAGPAKSIVYEGFTIHAAPYQSEGQYQTAGSIEKEVAGVRKEHKFIRADRHPSFEQAVEFALAKGKQIIDEQGERIFER